MPMTSITTRSSMSENPSWSESLCRSRHGMMQSSFVQGDCRVATRPGRLSSTPVALRPRLATGLPLHPNCYVDHASASGTKAFIREFTGGHGLRLDAHSSLPICEHVFAYGRLHPVLPIRAR